MKISVVIPCYKVKQHIVDVISQIGPDVSRIYVVDDQCPEQSGKWVESNCNDPRIKLIFNEQNLGVGGAVMAGYRAAIEENMDIAVKVDGDGQMNPSLIPLFIKPIISEQADYTKGNRFYNPETLASMPKVRLIGNSILSFLSKFSSGYWDIFDPTNGYTAIHLRTCKQLPFQKISNRYFFESDILYHLNLIQAKVMDIPMEAKYGDEVSNLEIRKIIGEFFSKHLRNFGRRIFYSYFLRDFSAASLELVAGALLIAFGMLFGVFSWTTSALHETPTTAGTVMLAAMPILVGIQLLLSFLSYDIARTPRTSLWPRLHQ